METSNHDKCKEQLGASQEQLRNIRRLLVVKESGNYRGPLLSLNNRGQLEFPVAVPHELEGEFWELLRKAETLYSAQAEEASSKLAAVEELLK